MSWSAAQKKYANSAKGKAARQKYQSSEKGKLSRQRYLAKRKAKIAETKKETVATGEKKEETGKIEKLLESKKV